MSQSQLKALPMQGMLNYAPSSLQRLQLLMQGMLNDAPSWLLRLQLLSQRTLLLPRPLLQMTWPALLQ